MTKEYCAGVFSCCYLVVSDNLMQVLAAKAQVFSIFLDAVRLDVLPPTPSQGAEAHLCPGMYLPPSAGDLDGKATQQGTCLEP